MKNKVESVIVNKVKQSHKIELEFNRLLRLSFLIPRNDVIKKMLFLYIVLFSMHGFAQETTYKEYSYTELFKMIEAETDTIFELKNAKLVLDSLATPQFYIAYGAKPNPLKERAVINKYIYFENVIFDADAAFNNIHFTRGLSFRDCSNFKMFHCQVDKYFDLVVTEDTKLKATRVTSDIDSRFRIHQNQFNQEVNIRIEESHEIDGNIMFFFVNNQINLSNLKAKDFENGWPLSIWTSNVLQFTFQDNVIEQSGLYSAFVFSDNAWNIIVNNNFIDEGLPFIRINNTENILLVQDNIFYQNVVFSINKFREEDEIGWSQFDNKLITSNFSLQRYAGEDDVDFTKLEEKDIRRKYLDTFRIQNEPTYNQEIQERGKFLNHYRNIHNTTSANNVYVEMKVLETQRMAYLYTKDQTFNNFFKWKVNQFLKTFSAFGTEPARAITFSMYVIFLFALIYLFFPNSWDKHGKNRIMNRYRFFTKYMNKESGIHEVYLEDKKDDLLEYNEFKNYMESSRKTIPKFFTATALPLYKWAMSSTKLSASILKRIDIMKGTWSDLPAHQRFWKSILLIGAFLLAVIYDIFIKMLNALMLSINTFTTLGFGEIPIKGLPRYLAIVQGFIGWFMLTIFSVSLISQLLN